MGITTSNSGIGDDPIKSVTSGLTIGGKITHVSLTDSAWTPLPTSPLANRNNLLVQNISGNGGTVLLNYINTAGATLGFRLADGGFKSADITDSIVIYGRMLVGTGEIVADEIA